ncbi:MAG: hypothetical protein Q9167_001861 [Letrouitia subvulpina]
MSTDYRSTPVKYLKPCNVYDMNLHTFCLDYATQVQESGFVRSVLCAIENLDCQCSRQKPMARVSIIEVRELEMLSNDYDNTYVTLQQPAAPPPVDKSREPPQPPTPLDFPHCQVRSNQTNINENARDLPNLFASAQNRGLRIHHIEALNVTWIGEVPLERMLPVEYLPPPQWQREPNRSDGSSISSSPIPSTKRLSNGTKKPGREEFFRLYKEVLYENNDGFDFVQRRSASPLVRIINFRKFWEHLLLMAEYWDTSMDNEISDTKPCDTYGMEVDPTAPLNTNASDSLELSSKNYTGRRIGTGHEMPANYRDETICRFIEIIAWQFGCRVEQPRQQPKLQLQGHIISMHQTASVYRTPKDPNIARRRILEGPLLGIQCRNTTTFRKPEDKVGEGKEEIRDLLMNEIGILLMLAQKRAREGKVEKKPWEGAWYVTRPRWGGGPGGEMGEAEKEGSTEGRERLVSGNQVPKKQKRRHGLRSVDHWKNLTSNTSLWEAGVTYSRVGKDKTSPCDQVLFPFLLNCFKLLLETLIERQIYLISSLNHHISIVNVNVSSLYVDYLTDGLPDKKLDVASQPWYALDVRRSKWFDLFNVEDRVQALRGVWAIMGYLMRDVEG